MKSLTNAQIDAQYRTLVILFFALLSSNVVFVGIALTAPPALEPPDPIMLFTLIAVSIMTLGVSFVLPLNLEKKGLAGLSLPIEAHAEADPNVPTSFAKHNTSRRFADPKAALFRALGVTMTPFILRMALREAIGIYGLMLAMLGHPLAHALPFLAVSFATQALEFPRLSRVADALEAAQNASLGPR